MRFIFFILLFLAACKGPAVLSETRPNESIIEIDSSESVLTGALWLNSSFVDLPKRTQKQLVKYLIVKEKAEQKTQRVQLKEESKVEQKAKVEVTKRERIESKRAQKMNPLRFVTKWLRFLWLILLLIIGLLAYKKWII